MVKTCQDVGKARHSFVIRNTVVVIHAKYSIDKSVDFFSWNVYRGGLSSILNPKNMYIMIAKSGNDD